MKAILQKFKWAARVVVLAIAIAISAFAGAYISPHIPVERSENVGNYLFDTPTEFQVGRPGNIFVSLFDGPELAQCRVSLELRSPDGRVWATTSQFVRGSGFIALEAPSDAPAGTYTLYMTGHDSVGNAVFDASVAVRVTEPDDRVIIVGPDKPTDRPDRSPKTSFS